MEEQKSVDAVGCLADANDTHAGGNIHPAQSITQAEAERVAEEWRKKGYETWESVEVGHGGKFGKRHLLVYRQGKPYKGKPCKEVVYCREICEVAPTV